MADPAEDDLLLTAYLDGELSQDERGVVSQRLASDPALRARLEDLERGGDNLRTAFSAALVEAPATDLRAKLGTRRAPPNARRWPLAAAVAVLAFLAGAAASKLLPSDESWRGSVAEYMDLYTPASFSPMDQSTLAKVLGGLSENVGVDLSEASLRSGDLSPRVGFPLQFKGAPLVEVGYVVDGAPAAFCVIRDGEADAAPTRQRYGEFNAVTWAKSGRGFLVISAAPAERVEALARALLQQAAITAP